MSALDELRALFATARFDLGEEADEALRSLADENASWARTMPARLARAGILELGFARLLAAELRISLEGGERLERVARPAIFVANHSSHLDAPLILTSLPVAWRDQTAVAAAADYFFTTWWMSAAASLAFNLYPVGRGGSRRAPGLSRNLLAEGWSLLIFPEGSRSADGKLGRFKPGAAALAVDLGLPVVPVALHGTYRAMPRGRNWPIPGRPRVGVRFGGALTPETGETVTAFSRRCRRALEALLEEDESTWWQTVRTREEKPTPAEMPHASWRRIWESSRPDRP